MCLGIPMKVQSCVAEEAICLNGDQQERVDMSLVGGQPSGTWVLVFMGAAREIITEQRAVQVRQALQAVEAVMQGQDGDLDHLFSDLLDREPQLPPHLQK